MGSKEKEKESKKKGRVSNEKESWEKEAEIKV